MVTAPEKIPNSADFQGACRLQAAGSTGKMVRHNHIDRSMEVGLQNYLRTAIITSMGLHCICWRFSEVDDHSNYFQEMIVVINIQFFVTYNAHARLAESGQ